ncbi:unnamed protein product [Cochlearia groenlandica]
MAGNNVLLPRFFKVFLSETASESMAIPVSFMEHLESPLPRKAKLLGTGGKTWIVRMKSIQERAFFTDGWSTFAEDHSLVDGEFLTFVYDGHRTFEVSVFGRFGCKETRAAVPVIELSDSVEEEEGEEEEEEDTSMNVVDCDNSNVAEDEEISQSIFTVGSKEPETENAVVAESTNLDVANDSPYFFTSLKPRIYELLIPAGVVAEHKLMFGEKINYIDDEGIMEGKRGKWSDERICFKGWGRICRRNRLRENDTVRCNILHTRKVVHSIKIQITRA